MVNEASNNQLRKETSIGIGQRKEKAEEPKYSDRSVEAKRAQQSNYNKKTPRKLFGENEQQDIKSESCMTCDKCVYTRVQCGYCQRWFHFRCEGTTKEKVMKEYPEEIQTICKQDKSIKQRQFGKLNIKQR